MTTISRNKKLRGRPYLRIFLAIIIVLLFLSILLWRDTFASVFWRLGEPLGAVPSSFEGGMSAFFAQFSYKATLEAENKRLREALASSTLSVLDRDLLYKENVELKKRLGHTASTTTSILAGILLRPPATPYDTLIIDAGLVDGVREGDLISGGGGSALGSVSEVYKESARVVLLSASGVTSKAELETNSGARVPFSVVGQGGGSMTGEVPSGVEVSVGDSIVFPGSMLAFVGKVSHVEVREGSSFTTLYFHLPINLFELKYIEVRRPPRDEI